MVHADQANILDREVTTMSIAGHGRFDYSGLPDDLAHEAQAAADRFRDWHRRTTSEAIEIGRTLLAVKDRLGHGRFGQWLKTEFGQEARTAQRLMRAAAAFPGSKSDTVSDLPLTTVYKLAYAPDAVRAEVIERLEAGERVEPDEIRKRVANAKRKEQSRPAHQGACGEEAEAHESRAKPDDVDALRARISELERQVQSLEAILETSILRCNANGPQSGSNSRTTARFDHVPISAIEVKETFRKDQDEEERIQTLRDSVGYLGLLQPIGLVPKGESGTYDLAWGALRLEAVRRLGWETVPAMIIDGQLIRLRLAENRRRFELHSFEVDDLEGALDRIEAGDENPDLVKIRMNRLQEAHKERAKREDLSALMPN